MTEDFSNYEIDWSHPEAILESARKAHVAADKAKANGDSETYRTLRDRAEIAYNGLLSRDYKSPFALVLLAVMDQKRGWNGRALALLQVAIAKLLNWRKISPGNEPVLDKWLRDAYCTMAFCHREEGRREDAEHAFSSALEYGPEDPEILSGFAGLYINDGDPQKCIDLINKAKKLDPKSEENHWNLALAHLELGNWKLGFEYYHKGVLGKQRLNLNYWRQGKTPLWEGEPDKTVVVYGEQGLGDEIMFASCLPEMIKDCKHVIFDCHPKLETAFKRSFPDIEIHGTRKDSDLGWAAERDDIEACIPIGSLPMLYRRKDSDFKQYTNGYLKAGNQSVQHYKERLRELGPPPYIGLGWEGGTKKTRFDLRSTGLRNMQPLLDQEATFISLQYTPEAARAAEKYGIPHWQEVIDDLDERHALIVACDLIISVNQTLVHQAGALAKRCWVLTPARPAWRYGLSGSKMIWYPTVRQYRQRKQEEPEWAPVVGRMLEDLKIFIKRSQKDAEPSNSRPRSKPTEQRVGAGD